MIDVPGYRIERELGRGGMATVYLAVQESLGRRVALKILSPHLAGDPGFGERFLREGRIAASLRHRHIIAIHDIGLNRGQAYMALGYLPRGTVADGEMPLPPREALRAVREIASALDLAHRHGVVHRDIKPENILRDDDGGYVLSDFGIAQWAQGGHAVTQEGSTVGTPAYMAPEQWRDGDVDGRADIYSLGVVLYQFLTGRVPYSGSDGWSIGMQHMQAPLPRLPVALGALQPLLDRMLAKDAASRYASGAAVVAAIEALERDQKLLSPQSTPTTAPQLPAEPAWRAQPQQAAALFDSAADLSVVPWWRRRALHVAIVIVTLGAMATAWWFGGSRRDINDLIGANALATVAVLPCSTFVNLAEHRELGDTLAEELIHRLSRLGGLTVIARSSSFPLRDAGLTAQDLGTRLGASHLFSCTIRRTPDGVRIGAELVDTASGALRWSAEYDRGGDDLLAVVDDLAVGISEQLLDKLAGPERALLIRHRTDSPEAIRLTEHGRQLAQGYTLEALGEARKAIDQALSLDPGYATAQVALAELVGIEMQLTQRDSAWWRAQVEPLLAKALILDPELASAYVLRAQLRCADYDWQGCRQDIERALALAPGAAAIQGSAADYEMTLGDRERAIEHARRRVQIEPESAPAWVGLAMALLHGGHADEALSVAEGAVARYPDHWPAQRARALALEQLGRCDAAVAAQEQALALADVDLEAESSAASLYACAGRADGVAALLREFQVRRASGDPISDMPIVVAELALGHKQAALDGLEAMYAARDRRLVGWITNPWYGITTLAQEPRLLALIERMHLPAGAMRWQPGRAPAS